MTRLTRILAVIVLSLVTALPAFAAGNFIIRRIEVHGLHRLSEGTVLTYMPIHVGQRYTTKSGQLIITSLFRTGFFSNVSLGRSDNVLIVNVIERPVIGVISIKGNKAIKTSKLKPVLKKLGVVVGATYDPSKLNEITQGLEQEYSQLGHNKAIVVGHALRESRNRVRLNIRVIEGPITKVGSIKIIGAHAFSESRLRDQFKLTTPGLLTWFTHSDRFSPIKLDMDLQHLQNFYLDHGYVRFHIVSHKVTYSSDHSRAYITVHVQEGAVYRIQAVRFAGLYANNPQLQTIAKSLRPGDVFSREQTVAVDKKVNEYFANQGYAFPVIQLVPQINDANHTVILVFHINKRKRVYVNQIHFVGNYRTKGQVLRAQMLQMENSVYDYKKIQISKQKLALLPYLKNVTVTPTPIPGHPHLVNLVYHMTEVNAGRMSVQGGYATDEGLIYGASIAEPNFMGTGKYVGISFMNSAYSSSATFSYNNPFYTVNGISMGYQVYFNRTKPDPKVTNMDPYAMNDLGGNLTWGIPLSNFDSFQFGVGYDLIDLSDIKFPPTPPFVPIGPTSASAPIIIAFFNKHPKAFSQFNLITGWSHVTLNRAIFPTKGNSTALSVTVGVPIIHRSVGYYKATLVSKQYFPLGHSGFIIEPHTTLGYGGGFGRGINGALPFYSNFFAGGIGSLPGFAPNSLGPQNPNNLNYTGGNVKVLGGINLIFPNGISDKLRTALFIAGGNVFETFRAKYPAGVIGPNFKQMSYERFALKNMRVAAGLMLSWYSPLGPIEISLGVPLVKKKGDDTEVFGFTFGTGV